MVKGATRAVAFAAAAGVVALAPIPATAIDRWYSGWVFPLVQPMVTAALTRCRWPSSTWPLVRSVVMRRLAAAGLRA
jgi:hypothetical protein